MHEPYPILVKVWAGEERHDMRYIRRSLPSLLASDLPAEAKVVFVDDCSPNRRLVTFLERLQTSDARVEIWRNPERLGPNKGQEYNVPRLWARFPDAPLIVCCDDDVIYYPGWLQRLIQVRRDALEIGLDGIYTALNTPARPSYRTVALPTSTVLLKERQMALNWLIPRSIYDRVGPFRDTEVAYDTDYANRSIELGIPVICLQPSWVQNIGYHGAYQHDETLTAPDYVGRRDALLVARDWYYGLRRMAINAAERIPEGRFKEGLKFVSKPLRWLMNA